MNHVIPKSWSTWHWTNPNAAVQLLFNIVERYGLYAMWDYIMLINNLRSLPEFLKWWVMSRWVAIESNTSFIPTRPTPDRQQTKHTIMARGWSVRSRCEIGFGRIWRRYKRRYRSGLDFSLVKCCGLSWWHRFKSSKCVALGFWSHLNWVIFVVINATCFLHFLVRQV